MVTTLLLFVSDDRGAVATLDAYGLDVGARDCGDTQPVQGQQRDERVLGGSSKPGGVALDSRLERWPELMSRSTDLSAMRSLPVAGKRMCPIADGRRSGS
jgi:hypothetical protein